MANLLMNCVYCKIMMQETSDLGMHCSHYCQNCDIKYYYSAAGELWYKTYQISWKNEPYYITVYLAAGRLIVWKKSHLYNLVSIPYTADNITPSNLKNKFKMLLTFS
jgi:hypothetical protein